MSSPLLTDDMERNVPDKILGKDVYLCGENSVSSGALSADSDIDVEIHSNDSANGSMHSSGYANGVSSIGSNGDSNGDSNGYSNDVTDIGCYKHNKRISSGIGTSTESFSDNTCVLRGHVLHKNQMCVGSESTGTSTDSDSFNRIYREEEDAMYPTKEVAGIDLEATTSFQQFHKVVEGAGKRKHIRRKPARSHQSRQVIHEELSSSSSSSPITEPLSEKPELTQACTTKSLASLYGNLHSKRSIEDGNNGKPALYIADVKSNGGMQPDQKRRRFHRTFDALKQCGLLDLTMQTASLIEQNQNLQQQLQALKAETQNLCMSLMSTQLPFSQGMANPPAVQGQGPMVHPGFMFNVFNLSQHACTKMPTLPTIQQPFTQNCMAGLNASQFAFNGKLGCANQHQQPQELSHKSSNQEEDSQTEECKVEKEIQPLENHCNHLKKQQNRDQDQKDNFDEEKKCVKQDCSRTDNSEERKK
ncbi:uncharacterized protein [Ptychodera flava]|uniref:uncharacterized protein n=1 Tax=Ptychodera flava TaxID=63121 RepID=UPI00396A500E